MKFHENLVKYRKLAGFTQEELAKKMQVSRQSVSKWENGEAVPELAKIIRLSELLNVSMDELCGRECKTKVETDIKKKTNHFKYAILIIIFSVTFGVCGYLIGQRVTVVDEVVSEVYELPDNIEVSAVDFMVEGDVLTCNFVPAIYSEKLTYTATIIDYFGNEKTSEVIFQNGMGKVAFTVRHPEQYKVILTISNGVESRNVSLAEWVYTDENAVSWQ